MTPWTILHGGALGDLALTLRLALRLPDVAAGRCTDVLLVSRVDPGDLTQTLPAVARISSDAAEVHWLFGDGAVPPPRLTRVIAQRNVLNFLSDGNAGVHTRLLQAGAARVFSVDPRPRCSHGHITEQWAADLAGQHLLLMTCQARRRQSALCLPEAARQRGLRLLGHVAAGSAAPVLIHPGSGGAAKCWPLECFRQVADLQRAGGVEVAFILGPVERERWLPQAIANLQHSYPIIWPVDTNELLDVLAAARCVVCNDCGPGHLAALIGTPTLSLFGPTDARRWHPLGPQAQSLTGRDPACSDWGLTPDSVTDALRVFLAQT